jgi:putative transposase
MATEGLSVQLAARVLDVSVSGFYEWKTRAPSARSIRHALLTEAIREVHSLSRGTYGFRRVHAEPTLGRGLTVAQGTVELLMARAGIKGLTGRPRWVRARPDVLAMDLVDRRFARAAPNQLWVTDIERHEALLNRAVVRGHRGRSVAAGR